MLRLIQQIAMSLVFFFANIVYKSEDCILISLDYPGLGSDELDLITRLPEETDSKVYVASGSPEEVDAQEVSIDFDLVEKNTIEFVKVLSRCKKVVIKSRFDLHGYRFFSHGDKEYIQLYHGIITKGYARYSGKSGSLTDELKDLYLYSGIDRQVVASDVERFYRSSAEGRHPKKFVEYGYPRYDRAEDLITGERSPVLKEGQLEKVESGKRNVLYAPTHKDSEYSTQVLPIENFEPNDLKSFLEENDIRLFLRMHPSQEDQESYKDLIDDEHVIYAGQDMSTSSVDILYYMDAVITDYSSIYVDFLPFDNPILFVQDDHQEFIDIRGIPFDYDLYFPGEKVHDMEGFKHHLLESLENDDGYREDRGLVRTVLLPDKRKNTAEQLLDERDGSE